MTKVWLKNFSLINSFYFLLAFAAVGDGCFAFAISLIETQAYMFWILY